MNLPTTFPAFKDWRIIVDALSAGTQIIILRKGGIAEGRGGFKVAANRFWLFPTAFHAQQAKTKPDAARAFPVENPQLAAPPGHVRLPAFADLVRADFLTDWSQVTRLDPCHLWTETTVRERFDWRRPPGIHLLIVRVHRLLEPLDVPLTPALAGCKSWVDLPYQFDDYASHPALNADAFAQKLQQVDACLQG